MSIFNSDQEVFLIRGVLEMLTNDAIELDMRTYISGCKRADIGCIPGVIPTSFENVASCCLLGFCALANPRVAADVRYWYNLLTYTQTYNSVAKYLFASYLPSCKLETAARVYHLLTITEEQQCYLLDALEFKLTTTVNNYHSQDKSITDYINLFEALLAKHSVALIAQ